MERRVLHCCDFIHERLMESKFSMNQMDPKAKKLRGKCFQTVNINSLTLVAKLVDVT